MKLLRFYDIQFERVTSMLRDDIDIRYRYHGLSHTLDVIEQSQFIGKQEKLSELELLILRIAALFHDTGFLIKREFHELQSITFFESLAREFEIEENYIALVSGCIRASQIPQNPLSLIEQVMGDADLDYLGRNDFKPIGDLLFEELKNFGEIDSEEDWNALQIRFLSKHKFHTHYSIVNRQPFLDQHLRELIQSTSL